MHVNWLGLTGAKDWDLIPVIEANDWTFVTKNSVDFRGPVDALGKAGQHTRLEYHDGLICLNLPVGSGREHQLAYFKIALEAEKASPGLLNEVIEVHFDPADPAGRPIISRTRSPDSCSSSAPDDPLDFACFRYATILSGLVLV